MTISISPGWIEQLGLADKETPEFFRSFNELQATQSAIAQAHVMRRAWEDLGLDGVFYQDKSPYIYFKEVSSIDNDELRELHRRLWNQGIAPFLVVISPTDFYVYSSLTLPATVNENINSNGRLVEVLSRTADALELRNFFHSLRFGEFFRTKPKSFNPSLRVDRYLLKNLEAAREQLLEPIQGVKLDLRIIHALLWRMIFISYLTDRKIIDSRYFEDIGAENVERLLELFETFSNTASKSLLYSLFEKLKEDFNGDLFEGDISVEKRFVDDFHIGILKTLLRGDNVSSGQISLGFWIYDFSVIPIETISGIYERFLEVENPKQKRESGAYYTPRFLAEIVLDLALEKFNTLLDKRFLDPACGSGIFLVSLFNRIAEEWLQTHQSASNEERASALISILQNQLYGIDFEVTETACRIAAFSLYLAFLDQLEPRDIKILQRQGNVLPNLVGHNILCKDFFDENLNLPDSFDLVVGNPPWANATGSENLIERWCEERSFPIAQRQLAYGFIWKASLHTSENGHVCFLLPTTILLNHHEKAIKAQQKWLSTHLIEKVVNLSDMRFYLFDGAIRPALIVNYRKTLNNAANDSITYLVPKTEAETLKAEIISISPEDHIQISVAKLLNRLSERAPLPWKTNFWGTPRDQKFLDRLRYLPCLGDVVDQLKIKPDKREKRWIVGQGFQPKSSNDDAKDLERIKHGKSPQQTYMPFWSQDQLFIEGKSKSIDLLLLKSDCGKVGDRFNRLRRLPDRKIFRAPHVLVKQGSTQGLKVGYSDFDVCFQDSIQSFHGPKEDADLLMFLSAVLNSPLASYFLFHTSANWGTERDKVHEEELLRIPFPFPEDTHSPNESKKIIVEVSSIFKSAAEQLNQLLTNRHELIWNVKSQLLPLIYDYYQVDNLEKVLIDDTVNTWIPSSTPNRGSINIPTLKQSQKGERTEYLTLLCHLLNTWAKRGKYHISGQAFVSTKAGLGIVVLQQVASEANANCIEQESISDLDLVLKKISNLLSNRLGSVAYYRNLKIFDEDKLYILKPLTFRYWSKTFALNDADEIAAAILTTNHRNE